MKYNYVHALLVISFAILGCIVAYSGVLIHRPIPAGRWQKIADLSKTKFSVDVERLKILAVDQNEHLAFIYENYEDAFLPEPGRIWKCDLDTARCSISDRNALPFETGLITVTHDIDASEMPTLPSSTRPAVDQLRLVGHVSDDICQSYYLLLSDLTVWSWGYCSSGGLIAELQSAALAIAGAITGSITATIVISLRIRSEQEATK